MRIIIAEAGVEYRIASEKKIRTPQDAVDAAKEIADSATECVVVLCLDAKNGLRAAEIVTSGIADCALLHPREVFRPAIIRSSSAIVLVHNHPSGDATPSAEDIKLTSQMIKCGRIIDIKVLDHVIISRGGDGLNHTSLREAGLCNFA